jgi:orotate phosphoribosyltransferase
MHESDVLTLFRRSGALLEGHFRLSSGLHSSGYLQCALVLQHPRDASAVGAALADKVRAWGATCVLAPALGGIVIGHEVARALDVRSLFAERQERTLTLRRGFTLSPDDRVLVVEDCRSKWRNARPRAAVCRAIADHAPFVRRGAMSYV